jgi:hypothetical protein
MPTLVTSPRARPVRSLPPTASPSRLTTMPSMLGMVSSRLGSISKWSTPCACIQRSVSRIFAASSLEITFWSCSSTMCAWLYSSSLSKYGRVPASQRE